jgi:Holliday junction resolvase-like predicted endonuclease
LPKLKLLFIQQEWRLAVRGKIDILAIDANTRRLAVVEVKSSQREARAVDAKKGGDALAQAKQYAVQIHEERQALFPFFERLARALARAHDGPEWMKTVTLDPEQTPQAFVCWP